MMPSVLFVKCNPSLHLFSRESPWSYHQVYVKQVYTDERGEIGIKNVDCGVYIKKKKEFIWCQKREDASE